jgi:hypothetical protein
MKKRLIYLTFGLLALIVNGCEKDSNSNQKVELYLIDNYSKIGTTYQINESSVIMKGSPLIYYTDILSYDSTEFIFELSDRAVGAIKNLEHSVHGLAFAIKADNKLIYTGYFWPSYSSTSCGWIVIDPLTTSIGNKMQVRLGYPGLIQGQIIPDKRNDQRIIQIFKQDNKLK